MTTHPHPRHVNSNNRLLFACYHFYFDPSNGASIVMFVWSENVNRKRFLTSRQINYGDPADLAKFESLFTQHIEVIPWNWDANLGYVQSPKGWENFNGGLGVYSLKVEIYQKGTGNKIDEFEDGTVYCFNAINSIYWESADSCTNAIQLGPNPSYNGGGLRCFPEQSDAACSLHNEILVMVDLAYAIPAGMTGTVHIDWFDPDNPRGSTIVPNHNGPGMRDNHGDFAIDGEVFEVVGGQTVRKGAELTFEGGSRLEWTTCTIDPAHAGDNYIIAAHPNSGVVQRAVLYNSSTINNAIVVPVWVESGSGGSGGNYIDFKLLKKSETLTVWRTLWVEIDQLVQYEAENGVPTVFYPVRRPEIGSIAIAAYADACIVLKDIGPANILWGWYGDNWAQMIQFPHLVTPIKPSTRQLPLDFSPTYWTNYTLVGWYQGTGSANCHPFGLYNHDGSDRTYLWAQAIDDAINLYLQNPPPGDPPVTSAELRSMLDSLVFAHEIGHTFWLNEWLAEPNIMHNQINISALLTNSDYFKFLDGQIQIIQSRASVKGR